MAIDVRPVHDFPGLTATECCERCIENANRGEPECVISGADCCLHPYKSGLQAAHRMQPQVLARFDRARKQLKVADAIAKAERN